MAIAISAAAPTTFDFDLSTTTATSVVDKDGNTISPKEVDGTVYALPLYDGDNALTYYLETTDDVTTLKAGHSSTYFSMYGQIKEKLDFVIVNLQDSNFENTTVTPKFQKYTTLKYVWLNETTKGIASWGFDGCSGLIEITIPSSVPSITQAAFKNCSSLVKIELAENGVLTSIGIEAFSGCSALTTFDFSKLTALQTIGNNAFKSCSVLEGEVVLAPTVTTIGSSAFNSCAKITAINIPDGVTRIESSTFNKCSSLTSVTFGVDSLLTYIGSDAFRDSGLTGIIIPKGVTEIGNLAFSNAKLTSVQFAEGSELTTLGNTVFEKNASLTEITLPSKLTSMGSGVFGSCKALTKINIPAGIESIGSSAFEGCNALTTVEFEEGSKLATIGYKAFRSTGLTSITIPNGVTEIGYNAFFDCKSLEYINLGASVKTFGVDSSSNSDFFHGCTKLKTVIMPATIVLSGTENGIFKAGSSSIKFFFTGTQDQLNTLKNALADTTNNTIFTGIENIVEYDATNKGAYDTAYDNYNSLSGAYIIYNYNKCEAFYNGVHTKSDAVLAYADGFDKSGTSTRTCPECGYTYESTTIDPIFTASGYSLGTDTMYAGFTVNTDALSAYNLYAGEGKELKYGIIVSNVNDSSITSVNFDDNKVITNENSIQIEITNYGFSRFGLTLTGFNDENGSKALNLVISAYVIDGDGNMSFVQSGTVTDATYVKTIDAIVGETTKVLGVVTFTKISELQA
ncbi:MAG: leucine-rich repeat domain-containing protein [Eubacteriales bacterium]